jgi:hypothetical protein
MKVVLGSTLLAMPFGLGLNGPAVAQQLQSACDANDDGFGSSQEAQLCTHREFDENRARRAGAYGGASESEGRKLKRHASI